MRSFPLRQAVLTERQRQKTCAICQYPQWDLEQCMPGISFYAAVEARLPARNLFDVGSAHDPELLGLSASADAGCTGCRVLRGVRRFAKSFETDEEVYKCLSIVRKFHKTSQNVEFEVNYKNGRPSRRIDVFDPTGPSDSLPWIRQCLSDCNAEHDCDRLKGDETYTPHRMLDLQPDHSDRDIRLIDTRVKENEDKDLSRYACVSHCWGETKNARLTTTVTLAQNCERIPLDELPLTFQDAVELARGLDIRYLWIDSMCIVQDSAEDWEAHVGHMAEIYGSGVCTLAAADATSDDGGFFRHVHLNFLSYDQINVRDGGTDRKLYIRLKLEHPFRSQYADSSWPLFTRGWVLQEYLMSPRFIAFGAQEVFWSCFQSSSCCCSAKENLFDQCKEAFRLDEVKALVTHVPPVSIMELYPQWRRLVEIYGALRLTYSSDRYVAIRGIASMFKQRLGDEYFEGMWRGSAHQDIAWMRWGKPSLQSKDVSSTERSPSWSFMPVLMSNMRVTWLYTTEPTIYTVLDVQLVRNKPLHLQPAQSSSSSLFEDTDPISDRDEFAPIASGTITLEGILLRAELTTIDSSFQAGLDHKLTMTLPDLPSLIDTHQDELCALVPPLTLDELRRFIQNEAVKQQIVASQDSSIDMDEDKLAEMAAQGVHVLQTSQNYVIELIADYDVEGEELMEKIRDARFFLMHVQEQKKTVSGMLLRPREKAQLGATECDEDRERAKKNTGEAEGVEEGRLPRFERVGWLTCAMPQCEWFKALPKTRFALV